MTDDDDSAAFPPAMFVRQLQNAGEQAMQSQRELYEQFVGSAGGSSALGPMGMGTATFKTRVQSGGRISIPDAEREALDIEEGDIVQAIIVPVKRNRDNDD